jgi:hypothetical protein
MLEMFGNDEYGGAHKPCCALRVGSDAKTFKIRILGIGRIFERYLRWVAPRFSWLHANFSQPP